MKTLQEAFNISSIGMIRQRAAALDKNIGMCRYRAGRLKCAVGMLIPDDKYDIGMESQSVAWLLDAEIIPVESTPENARFLQGLQRIHDKMEVKNWPAALVGLGHAIGLSIPSIVNDALVNQEHWLADDELWRSMHS